VTYALVALVLVLSACSAATDTSSAPTTELAAEPTAEGTTKPTVEPTTGQGLDAGEIRPVPVMVGARLRDVRVGLRDHGWELKVRRRTLCAPGVVLEQRPAPGTKLERGATVRLVVAQAPAAATCALPSAAPAVLALRAWARGDEAAPQFADRVRLLVADRPFRTLTATDAADRAAWTLEVAYAERSDVRILDVLSGSPTREANVPPLACLNRGRVLPADLVRRLPWSWSLVTRDARACLEVAAVQVWADEEGRITDVNVLLGSP
jgi:hypothetical protein